jgi:pimeloyl-[acyl-carrier protein] synthase
MMSSSFQFNPLSPEFLANPYAYYSRLRSTAPIFYWKDKNIWFLTRYDDCVAMLKEPRLGQQIKAPPPSDGHTLADLPQDPNPYGRMKRHWILFKDPPEHTRLRGLVHKAFTPRVVESLQTKIQAIAESLLDATQSTGQMDMIGDFAFPLSITVIAEMLGVPASDSATFRRWSHDFAMRADLAESKEVFDRTSAATLEFAAYLNELVSQRRHQPTNDLLGMLVAVEEQGDRLTEEELIATAMILLVAGHETTANLIGNGVHALLRNPEQYQRLKEDPSLIRSAIEEFLRYESPVQMSGRFVLEDFEFRGQDFRRGQQVAALLGAANRDPERFADPDCLDIGREDNKHIAFGNGIHFCVGAPLARLEAQIAFDTLIRRRPNLKLADDNPAYRPTYTLRGFQSLPVTV